jgi:hypothetical protein
MAEKQSTSRDPGTDPMADFESSKDVVDRLDTEPRNQEGLKTAQPPKEADKTSDPVPNDAEPHDEPVRTNRPDGRIVGTLATGAGEHRPLADPDFGPDGRPSPEIIQKASQQPSPDSPAARQAERRGR